ncbi:MAG: hypothetical protein ACKO3P_05115, partial [Planctomycetaceae bacterium]
MSVRPPPADSSADPSVPPLPEAPFPPLPHPTWPDHGNRIRPSGNQPDVHTAPPATVRYHRDRWPRRDHPFGHGQPGSSRPGVKPAAQSDLIAPPVLLSSGAGR